MDFITITRMENTAMAQTEREPISILRRVPVFPSLEIVRGFPTVNGVRYCTFSEALEAKRRGVEYIWIDIFGIRHDDPTN